MMDNDSNYYLILGNKIFDIVLSRIFLIIIRGVFGMIWNFFIIYLYFFCVKERGERYFIFVFGVVDLLGCLIGVFFYIMDNIFFFYYLSIVVCSVLFFL